MHSTPTGRPDYEILNDPFVTSFTAKSISDRILETGQHSAKLWIEVGL